MIRKFKILGAEIDVFNDETPSAIYFTVDHTGAVQFDGAFPVPDEQQKANKVASDLGKLPACCALRQFGLLRRTRRANP